MCIVFLAIDQHPDYPLIIAANRDEYHDRPSAHLGFWEDCPRILAGKDLRAGGTWLGLTRSGYFCTVTNHADKPVADQEYQSRGQLVRQFLFNEPGLANSRQHLLEQGHAYRPFNLVFGHAASLHAYSNREQKISRLGKGYHSVSNGPMDQTWPKMHHGVRKLTDLIDQGGDITAEILTDLMLDQTLPCNESSAPRTSSRFSPIFIQGDRYGTRATTCLLFSERAIRVCESNYESTGRIVAQHEFTIEPAHAA